MALFTFLMAVLIVGLLAAGVVVVTGCTDPALTFAPHPFSPSPS